METPENIDVIALQQFHALVDNMIDNIEKGTIKANPLTPEMTVHNDHLKKVIFEEPIDFKQVKLLKKEELEAKEKAEVKIVENDNVEDMQHAKPSQTNSSIVYAPLDTKEESLHTPQITSTKNAVEKIIEEKTTTTSTIKKVEVEAAPEGLIMVTNKSGNLTFTPKTIEVANGTGKIVVIKNKDLTLEFLTAAEAAKETGFNPTTVRTRCSETYTDVNGNTWSYR
jgi:hypothetical protein